MLSARGRVLCSIRLAHFPLYHNIFLTWGRTAIVKPHLWGVFVQSSSHRTRRMFLHLLMLVAEVCWLTVGWKSLCWVLLFQYASFLVTALAAPVLREECTASCSQAGPPVTPHRPLAGCLWLFVTVCVETSSEEKKNDCTGNSLNFRKLEEVFYLECETQEKFE